MASLTFTLNTWRRKGLGGKFKRYNLSKFFIQTS